MSDTSPPGPPGPSGVPGLPGGEAGFDFGALIAQATQVQAQIQQAQAELAETEVTGTAGGGLVTVTMTGTGEVVELTIDPEALASDEGADAEETAATVADLVLAALHDAAAAARSRTEQVLGPFSAALGDPGGLPGLGGGR